MRFIDVCFIFIFVNLCLNHADLLQETDDTPEGSSLRKRAAASSAAPQAQRRRIESRDPEVHDRYLRNLRDYNEAIADIVEKSLAQGEEQGRTKERAEIARLLLGDGMDPAQVAKATKLSLEDVRKLQEESAGAGSAALDAIT